MLVFGFHLCYISWMISKETINVIRVKYDTLKVELGERGRRMWAAAEAKSLGYGGVAAVSKATAIAESTIRIGRREMATSPVVKRPGNIRKARKAGGGRKPLVEKDAELLRMLDALVEPSSRGDHMSPLRWTCKSTRKLAQELASRGHAISHTMVGQLLAELNYSLQSVRKRMEGKSHPDRDAQFKFINGRVIEFQKGAQPVISVDSLGDTWSAVWSCKNHLNVDWRHKLRLTW